MSDNLPAVQERYQIMTFEPAELKEIISENLGGAGMSHLDLPRVRIPTGGGTQWTIPDPEGEKSERVLKGIIVYQTVARGYWEASFDEGGGQPPTCYSNDGKTGQGDPGGDCSTCKFNQWNSDRRGGKGKACRELRLLFMIQGDSLLPTVIALPPTSVKPAHHYFVSLTQKGIPYWGVETEIVLEKERSDNGISYAKASFKMAQKLSKEETATMRAYKEAIAPTLIKVQVTAADTGEVRASCGIGPCTDSGA